jgi:hypothetical protein
MAGTHGIHGMLGTIHGDVIQAGIRGAVVGITVGTHGVAAGIMAGEVAGITAGAVVGIMETGIVSIHRKDVFPEQ